MNLFDFKFLSISIFFTFCLVFIFLNIFLLSFFILFFIYFFNFFKYFLNFSKLYNTCFIKYYFNLYYGYKFYNLIGGYLINLKIFLKEVINEFKSAFVENKYLFIITLLLFTIPMFIGYFGADSIKSFMEPMFNTFNQNIDNGTVTLTTSSLFLNNFKVIVMLFAGFSLFAIVGGLILTINGLFLGYYATKLNLIVYIAFIIPHGIFEISSLLLSSFAGLIILSFILKFFNDLLFTKFEDNKDNLSDNGIEQNIKDNTIKSKVKFAFNNNSSKLKQALVLFVVAIILLAIAAFVEANLTTVIAFNFLHMLGYV